MTDAIYILAAAALSRFAGKGWGGKSLFALAAGICAALAFNTGWIGMALIAAGVSVGRCIGLGGAIGWWLGGAEPPDDSKEWWQVGFIGKDVHASVLVLALMRGMLLIPALVYDTDLWMLPGYLFVGVLLFAWIGKEVADRTTPNRGWAMQEMYPLALLPVALVL